MKHEIINNGKPNIKNMSKPEFNVFCKSILDIMIEDKKSKEKEKSSEMDSIVDILAIKKLKAPDFSDACI